MTINYWAESINLWNEIVLCLVISEYFSSVVLFLYQYWPYQASVLVCQAQSSLPTMTAPWSPVSPVTNSWQLITIKHKIILHHNNVVSRDLVIYHKYTTLQLIHWRKQCNKLSTISSTTKVFFMVDVDIFVEAWLFFCNLIKIVYIVSQKKECNWSKIATT